MSNNMADDMINGYDSLAPYYDRLQDAAYYRGAAKYIDGQIKAHLQSGTHPGDAPRVLDVACGTGRLAELLRRRGYSLTGIDSSEQMLGYAAGRYGMRADMRWLPGDMTRFKLPELYDAAVCCTDSVNYILQPDALRGFFMNISRHLLAGGLFIFDVNTPAKFREQLRNYCSCRRFDDFTCVWSADFNARTRLCEYEILLFIENEAGSYDLREEKHVQREYAPAELEEIARSCRFEIVNMTGNYDMGVRDRKYRMCYTLRKPV